MTLVSSLQLSVGIAEFDRDDELNLEKSIHRADEALYDAKKGGRNRVCQA